MGAAAARATGMTEFLAPFGAMSAANWIAVQASHYFHRYGGDRTTLGWVAVNARANAARNPEAVYREPFTIDDYFAARLVTTPFGLYDCDVPVDGAVAVVVSAIETAADRPRPPVLVEAVGTQILERLSWDQDTLSHEPQTKGPSRHLWSRTEPAAGRRGRRAAVRRLHLQRGLLARVARVLRAGRRPRLHRRGPRHRPRRPAAA